MEAQALARANVSEDTITKKKYESDSDGLEIEGFTNTANKNGSSKPPSLLKSLLSANAVQTSSKAPVKGKQ